MLVEVKRRSVGGDGVLVATSLSRGGIRTPSAYAAYDEAMWPVFADPKTDEQRIDDLAYLSPEQARMAGFTSAEWDAYDRAKVAEQDARGAISLAERQGEVRGETRGFARGHEQGLADGLRRSLAEVCELLAIPLDPSRRAEIGTLSREQLEALLARLKRERRWD